MILSSKKRVLVTCLLSIALPVSASCLGSGDAEIEALAKDIGRQPHQALQAIELALTPERNLTVERRAWFEVARAQAKRMLGLEKAELPQAIEDAKELPQGHPALLNLQIANLYGAELSTSTFALVDSFKLQLAQLPSNQPTTLCSKIRLASVMADYNALNGETFELASDVYHHANTAQLAWMRAEAASVLGQVALRADNNYGRQLNEEALLYFESQGMYDMVANELFMSGLSWAGQRDRDSLQKAEQQFLRSEAAAALALNPFGITYAKAGLCRVQVELGRIEEALHSCSTSLQQLKGIGHVTEYSTIVNYAAALLADDSPEQAMDLLAPLTKEWPGFDVSYYGYRFYDTRGRTHEALGNADAAIADLKLALRELQDYESNSWERNNRLMQSRFRVEELLGNLERKKQEAEESEKRNSLLIGVGIIIVSLLLIIVRILVRHRRIYRSMAFTDPLTGLANRRYTMVRAQEAFEHAKARQQQLYIALIDLDRFKSCNDRYGHDAGDEALQQFARVAESVLRPGDLIGRWGGEEFLLVLQGIDKDTAAKVLERLRDAAAKVRLTLAPEYPLQFSAGVVEPSSENTSIEELVMLADKALYRAKEAGRNRSCFAEVPMQNVPQPSA
ncbi:MAG: GGDEF domain-containing protein [Gammaproteobacteria bacterium]|nr:GGDEF domain-containing protein [Gammaproteobacteria bacterium]MBU1555715.1 GGDEF domain-containing protein [Gammaproteobacteria bacterium]MBU2069316.1 GGDEF domain-containing protein [Gammaproteobacteria bacterium]MBU2183369.1 GGDEF domain-containing protein [Gammaproteobacteria bacterium]MBU2204526.1 GGDEF domain-containing protein [Gammaproteobacteria bacterium]